MRANNAFGQIRKLGDTIQQMSANVLMPRAIASFHGGASLPFGKTSLSQAGISTAWLRLLLTIEQAERAFIGAAYSVAPPHSL